MKKKEIVAKIIDKFILMIINFNFYISFDATKTMLKEVDLRHSYITPSIKWGVRDLNSDNQLPKLAVYQVSVTPL